VNITEVARVLIEGVRVVGPVLVALAVLVVAVELLSRPGQARLRLAHVGLSAPAPNVLRRLLAGTLVPALGVAALAVSLSLEQEVREGPNRMVERLQSEAGPHEPAWILQRGTSHFMNDSRLPPAVEVAAATDSGGSAHRLWEQLVAIRTDSGQTDTGLLLGTPAGDATSPFRPAVVAETAGCRLVDGACVLKPGQAVADADVYPVGSRLSVRGRDLEVVATTAQPYSLINRAVVFTDSTAFARADGTPDTPFAVVVGGPDALSRAEALVAGTGAAGAVEVLTGGQVKSANADFWAGNGTPLLLLVICLSGTFCGVALYGARRALHQRERMSTGTLQALGVRLGQVCRIDLLRAVMVTGVAAVLAVPVAWVLVLVVDTGMLGFHATLTPLFVAAAAGLLVLANVLGTAAMWVRMRTMSVVEAISQP
jgi:hypothetical protein